MDTDRIADAVTNPPGISQVTLSPGSLDARRVTAASFPPWSPTCPRRIATPASPSAASTA
jgi:hypothetical protein